MRPCQRADAREARTHSRTGCAREAADTSATEIPTTIVLKTAASFWGRIWPSFEAISPTISAGTSPVHRLNLHAEGGAVGPRTSAACHQTRAHAGAGHSRSPHNSAQRPQTRRTSPAESSRNRKQCAADGRGARRRRGFTTVSVSQTRPHLLGAAAQVLPACPAAALPSDRQTRDLPAVSLEKNLAVSLEKKT